MSGASDARTCRFCAAPLTRTFVDLGETPLANSYLTADQLGEPEPRYPLHARVCDGCLLVQVDDVVPAAHIFSDYAYFSSVASSWVEHARRYAEMAIRRFGLDGGSRVVEVASNDGYLLQHFVGRGIPVLGIEPAANVAAAAESAGVPTRVAFFGRDTADAVVAEHGPADLLVGNNVLAHVPDLNDFVAGLARALAPDGVLTMEFPHLLKLIEEVQFDTIYHEHFSYYSLLAVERIFAHHGLALFDVEWLPTHGGSLRIFAQHAGGPQAQGVGLAEVRALEAGAVLDRPATYDGFEARVARVRDGLTAFLDEARNEGRVVAAYGAAAKGNTLLNYCGVGPEQIAFVADANPHKQDRFLPGSHIPIVAPEELRARRPDDVLILPWNLRDEITASHDYVRDWGGRFIVAIPEVRVLP